MGLLKLFRRLAPTSLQGQMVAVLALSLAALFSTLMVLELIERRDAVETAESSHTLERLKRLYPLIERIPAPDLPAFIDIASSCHAGHTVTDSPFPSNESMAETRGLHEQIARELSVDPQRVRVGRVRVTREDFSYRKCRDAEIQLPADAIVIGVQLASGQWLNTEVHPHESHIREKLGGMLRVGGAFIVVGAIAIWFMRRLNKPLNSLTAAAQRFGSGLQPSMLEEDGPADLRRAIRAFNVMQQQVTEEIARRTSTLAAISHDVRTPLTALRVKAELIDDAAVREDMISSIDRMERITASALEFLKGQSRGEPLRVVNLSALLESECIDFEEQGLDVKFVGEQGIEQTCRPDALARAVRNLIDNAVKYGGSARVATQSLPDAVHISVSDHGPGIPADQLQHALEPFVRLSAARESNGSGFGLGLAVVKAVAEGHDGELSLAANDPSGVIATIRLPRG